MTSPNDWNQRIMDEFHANGGRVGGPFEGRPVLLLTTTGARSGTVRTTPLVYLPDGERWIVFASKGGAPTNPAWYHNLIAHPEAEIEVGTEKVPVTATVLKGEERDRLYAKQAGIMPAFAEYQQRTARKIPVVALQRRAG
ncbi:MAG TPA: nitroreductase family deazaflavin-dependent oxidoreductase [Dehalococcoidia bacterium]|jgi:deazaflavin-dependent oxidoreductase (nitroreductase family)|nr:nitroreductase family deazaflavin-dependent oxidoreductase [Dehalococcoidia bacterium]